MKCEEPRSERRDSMRYTVRLEPNFDNERDNAIRPKNEFIEVPLFNTILQPTTLLVLRARD